MNIQRYSEYSYILAALMFETPSLSLIRLGYIIMRYPMPVGIPLSVGMIEAYSFTNPLYYIIGLSNISLEVLTFLLHI